MSLVSPALHWDRSHFDRDDGISALASTPPDARSLPPAHRGEVEVAFCLRHAGMRTLRDDGVAKVLAGQTTTSEVERVTMRPEEED